MPTAATGRCARCTRWSHLSGGPVGSATVVTTHTVPGVTSLRPCATARTRCMGSLVADTGVMWNPACQGELSHWFTQATA